jgi:chlorophyll synthase
MLMLGELPSASILALALLYSVAAHGIMTLNDFKSIEGDISTGVRSIPVQLGPGRAARVACGVMLGPQVIVALLLLALGRAGFALAIGAVCLAQLVLMRRLLADPRRFAPWYNATGVGLLVTGMLIAAVAVR